MTLLLDLALIPKPVTDQGIEETQPHSSQEETSFITEGAGNTFQYM